MEWIDPNKALPKIGEKVIIHLAFDDGYETACSGQREEFTSWYWRTDFEDPYTGHDDFYPNQVDGWMPLPKSPKERNSV